MKVKMKKEIFFLVIIALLLVLTTPSCKPTREPLFWENATCQFPCWGNIKPGESSVFESMEILKNMKTIDSPSIHRAWANQYPYPDQLFFNFKDGVFGSISIKDDIVVDIDFNNVNVSLESITKVFGEPDQLFIAPYHGTIYSVMLLYRPKNIWLSYIKAETGRGKIIIEPADQVREINLSSKDAFSLTLNNYCGNAELGDMKVSSNSFEDYVQPWKGFGKEISFTQCFINYSLQH
jgi:hypothetical protein